MQGTVLVQLSTPTKENTLRKQNKTKNVYPLGET
jgi:hypothetical protein